MSARARFVLGGDWRLARLVAACVLTAVLITSCAQNATPQPDPSIQRSAAERTARNAYELQESCGRTSREWFKQFFGNEADRQGSAGSRGFENHYNAKANKCYAVESGLIQSKGAKAGTSSLTAVRELVDVNENLVLGEYYESITRNHVDQCVVAGRKCQSSAEWDTLVKPYMVQ